MSPSLTTLFDNYKDKKKNGLISSIRNNEDYIKEIINLTEFLDHSTKISARVYCILNDIDKKPLCYCGKQKKFHKINRGFFRTCGNEECVSEALSEKAIENNKKIDWEQSIRKQRQTNLNRYGVESNFNNGPIRESYKKILKQKYDVEHPLQNKELLNKAQQTTLKRHGTLNMIGSEKVKKTIQQRYGVNHVMKNEIIKNKSTYKTKNKKDNFFKTRLEVMNMTIIDESIFGYKLKCKKCDNIMSSVLRQKINVKYRDDKKLCDKCFPVNTFRSNFEDEVYNELKTVFYDEIQLNRQYLGMEIDILIPSRKIAIECNGVYWHSELHKLKSYHKEKKEFIEKQGYNLIQIWEDDWKDVDKRKIIINRLKVKLGIGNKIYARKCGIKEVKGKVALSFINNYHLKKYAPASINVGLFYNEELVSITTFISRKKSGYTQYEILRNCTKDDNIIIGGISKVIKYFSENYNSDIYSFADCDWTSLNNSSYTNTGFILEKYTDPGYYWVINGLRRNRQNYMKHKLVKAGFNKNKTEIEIMHGRGYYRVWDSGNLKFKYKKN